MNYDPLYIALGTLILIVISFVTISLYSFLYLKYVTKTKNFEWGKILLSSAVVSAAWLFATMLTIILAGSVSAWIFAAVAMALLFSLFYFSSLKLFGIDGRHKIYYALVLALVLNPIWFSVLGVI